MPDQPSAHLSTLTFSGRLGDCRHWPPRKQTAEHSCILLSTDFSHKTSRMSLSVASPPAVLILDTEPACLPVNPPSGRGAVFEAKRGHWKQTQCFASAHGCPVERCLLLTQSRVFVCFRARSMTEQQEQSEETGLLPSQDLDPSKEDDAHGHFRQISHTCTKTATLAVSPCSFFFHPHTICILCMVMGSSPGRFIFTALILCFYFGHVWSQTIVACTQTKRPQTEIYKGHCYLPPFPKDQ